MFSAQLIIIAASPKQAVDALSSMAFFAVASLLASLPSAPLDTKPHFLLVLADDLGWGNVGWHRKDDLSDEVVTPTLDKLVEEGSEWRRPLHHSNVQPSG